MNSSEWIQKAGTETELIVSVDTSDPTKEKYIQYYAGACYMNNNQSLVEATNHAAKQAKGDILVYLSDDFKCFDNWGKVLIKEFNKYPDQRILLKVDDCLQPFETAVLTIPIMNKACHVELGYFFHPDFRSMHCDEQLYWRTRKLGFLKMAKHIKFEHWHHSIGKAEDDDTYRRSAANWNHGIATFAKHKKMGFIS